MLIRKALKKLRTNYKKALSLEYVLKPVSWALYQTWKEIDAEEEKYKKKVDNSTCSLFKDCSKSIELHCKPGDVVYYYCEELHEILDYTVYCINLFRDNGITYCAEAYDEENAEALSEIGFEPEDIGRDVFLTREEAEQALKKGEK